MPVESKWIWKQLRSGLVLCFHMTMIKELKCIVHDINTIMAIYCVAQVKLIAVGVGIFLIKHNLLSRLCYIKCHNHCN